MTNLDLPTKSSFALYAADPNVKNLIVKTLGSTQAASRLITALISTVSSNPQLSTCDPKDILYAAFYGESLGLLPLNQLGHYYIVPYFDKKSQTHKASFQLGYKGLVQLAVKTGKYRTINATPIKDGELLSWNPATEEAKIEFVIDQDQRDKLTTIGYFASFELTNGFKKSVYWTRSQVERHAAKFSKSFGSSSSIFWTDNFDAMARKTVLRSLLINWGVVTSSIADVIADPDMTKIVEENPIGITISNGDQDGKIEEESEALWDTFEEDKKQYLKNLGKDPS
jgi:recombination protein RecT